MNNSPSVFLPHIQASIKAIEDYSGNVTEKQFYSDRMLQMAIMKELEIIGEAVRNLPPGFKLAHPDIPWKDISGMRNFLIHEYFEIDLDLVWDTVKSKIPQLQRQISKLLKEIKAS